MNLRLRRSLQRRTWLPYLVLLCGLLLTLVATYYVASSAETKDELRFQNAIDQIQRTIENRLETYVALLRAGSGLFAATDALISEAAFREYVAQLSLQEAYLGVQGFGYAQRVAPDERASLEARMRDAGQPSFRIWPEGERSVFFPIVYLEPPTTRNLAALGYDMFSDPVRQAAMVRARDTGQPAATGKVTLVQEITPDQQAGFLIYEPVYRGGGVPTTVEARRAALQGFVYSPFRADDLLAGILGTSPNATIDFMVYDGNTPTESDLLFRSRPNAGSNMAAARFIAYETMNVAGQPWTLVFETRPAFERASERHLVPWVLVGGLLISGALFALTRLQGAAREAAETLARDLRTSESRFRTLVEQSPFSTQIFASDGETVRVNRAWEQLWGTTLEELQGYNVLSDEQLVAKGIMPYVRRAFDGEATAIPPIRYVPDEGAHAGRPHWVSAFIYPVKDEDGAVREVVLIHEDVSERKRAEVALELLAETGAIFTASLDHEATLQNLARLVVPTLADYCLIVTLEEPGRLRQVASAHIDPDKEALTRDLSEQYVYDPNNTTSFVARVMRTGEPLLVPQIETDIPGRFEVSETVRRIYQTLAPQSFMVLPLSARGRTLGTLTMVYAESDRRYSAADLPIAEELARRAALAVDNARLYREAQEAIRVRDQFLSVASHDLKTPITSMKGYADLLLRRVAREGGLTERNRRAVEIIREEATRLTRLVDLLLDASRIQTGRLEIEQDVVDVGELVQRLVEVLRPTMDGHQLKLHRPDARLPVAGDDLRLEQVFQNLLQNAIKYSPNGGTIHIVIVPEVGHVCVTVRDEGVGIPQEALPHLFHRFYRADNVATTGIGGQGLGLYIAHYLVEAHGGTISVESEEGVGSTFTVRLPLLPSPAAPDGAPRNLEPKG